MKGGIWLVFLAALVASIYGTALGAEVSINSDTYLKYFEDTSGNSYMPLYEYLSLSAGSSTGEGVSFHLGGYLSQDIDNTLYEKQTDTNLQYGYIGYLNKGAGIHIQLGRLYVMEGLSPGQIDGLTGKKTFGPLGVGLFVGDPVEDPDATVKADLTFGGRVNLTGASYDIGLS
ncbi:MAG: hypothetical protein D6778_03365 [Nitrospirae bacterium]|nr:MAG: hypothetical protein D6778_03365 [Nitrospirota bacterium]